MFLSGSFAVNIGVYFRSGIVRGSMGGSFTVRDHLQSRTGILIAVKENSNSVLLSDSPYLEAVTLTTHQVHWSLPKHRVISATLCSLPLLHRVIFFILSMFYGNKYYKQ